MGWLADFRRNGLSEILFQSQPQVSPRHRWLRTIYEPLRDTLALLQIHPRGDLGQTAELQQWVRLFFIRAGDGIRTRDVQLGKLALYH